MVGTTQDWRRGLPKNTQPRSNPVVHMEVTRHSSVARESSALPTPPPNTSILNIGVASSSEYAVNRIQPDGSGKTKQYTVYDRRTRLAQLKLHDDEKKITMLQPLEDKIKDGDYYEMRALRHGTVLIINNKNFVAHSERTGTDRDGYNLIQTFYFLGYCPIICNNLTSATSLKTSMDSWPTVMLVYQNMKRSNMTRLCAAF